MANKLNPNDAPKGYIAQIPTTGICEQCVFETEFLCPNVRRTHSCTKTHRKDMHTVVFVKSEK